MLTFDFTFVLRVPPSDDEEMPTIRSSILDAIRSIVGDREGWEVEGDYRLADVALNSAPPAVELLDKRPEPDEQLEVDG